MHDSIEICGDCSQRVRQVFPGAANAPHSRIYATRQTFIMLVPPGAPMGSPQVMA